jgi:hypothetical protein
MGDLSDDTDDGAMMGSFQADAVAAGNINSVMGQVTVDPDTLAVTVQGASPSQALPSGGFFQQADYFGAVDPTASTPFWQGWTAIDSRFEGNLPGQDFHPLQAEIEDGTISPAASSQCTTLGSNFAEGGTVDVFGATFPVCVVTGDLMSDVTLPNNHVFVLDGTVNVGNGGAMGGAANAANVTLTISAGTQIYAAEGGAGAALVATRGSQIVASGTRDQPIVMAAVAVTRN